MPSDARFCVRLDGHSLSLSASEPVLIVVATDAESAGVLEAADLIHNGVAASSGFHATTEHRQPRVLRPPSDSKTLQYVLLGSSRRLASMQLP